jgi:dolichyl-diphosphooligosaccharide--protein glycosyltransferase
LETLTWIKLNTPENAVIASWWDYGYWITTLSDRTTIVDNATLSTKQIQKMAQMLMSTPDNSWNMLKEMNADYVVIFVSAQKINDNVEDKLYVLGQGGDESKSPWFAQIGDFPVQRFYESDFATPNNYFDEQTMLGKMIPFSAAVYYEPQTQENSPFYKPGFVKILSKEIKYDSDDDPLKLVYASPSLMNEKNGPMNIVLVYEVNKNFLP